MVSVNDYFKSSCGCETLPNEDNFYLYFFLIFFAAANDRIEVVNPETDLSHQQILKSHIRYISDIDWNPKEPEAL